MANQHKRVLDTIVTSPKKNVKMAPVATKKLLPVNQPSSSSIYRKRFKIYLKKYRPFLAVILTIGALIFIFGPAIKIGYTTYQLLRPGKYMIAFQNNAELRGGGGFLGTFAIIDFDGRQVDQYYFESNIYKKDNEFVKTNRYELPTYFTEIFGPSVLLALRDANYPADFRDAAANMGRFYQLEYGEKLNGVIGINASLVRDMLAITGPITIPSENITITKDNFFDVLQSHIQQDYFESSENKTINEPKNILKEMMPLLLKKLRHSPPTKLYDLVVQGIREKNIVLSFFDRRAQIVHNYNWDGAIDESNAELLFISNNNIGGEKTSLRIDQAITLSASSPIDPNRHIQLSRFHMGSDGFQTEKVNKNYSKIFLPAGSKIDSVKLNKIETKQYEISFEHNRIVLGIWTTVGSGERAIVDIDYTLKDIVKPHILYQRQPGSVPDHVIIQMGNETVYDGRPAGDMQLL